MKKLLFSTTIAFLCFCISCNNEKKGGLSVQAQKNLDAQHGVSKCFDTKDFSKLGDYIAEDAVDHAGETGDVKGLANMKTEFEQMTAGIDNAKSEVIKELADDDYVMSWMHFTGTLKTDMMGMKAGDKYNMKAIEVAKFKDGKAVEHWTFMEPAEMMKMSGSPQTTMPMKDTTMKK
ncbi:MAG: hypothetical protein EPN92_01195 [Chitinophagaceae bacterium]|nr:MAG: hypothetical protein EPN92_01195 [Chitinophagaceae bacterium]